MHQRVSRTARASLRLALSVAAGAGWAPLAVAEDAGRFLPAIVDEAFECAECPHGCSHAKTLRGRLLRGENPDGTPMDGGEVIINGVCSINGTPAFGNIDLLHYDLNIEINPSTGFLGGFNVMSIKAIADGVSTFRFRLDDLLPISSVRVNGSNASFLRVDPIHVDVTLDRSYMIDEQFTVRVDYAGFPQNNGFDAINFTTQNGVPIASTLSETDFAYTWWPTVDNNYDKSTADLRYTIPSTMAVASNGSLLSITPGAPGKNVWYWKTEYQTATYLYSFAVTNFNRFSSTYNYSGGSMPLEFFIWPASDTTTNRNGWLASGQMLATFAPIFGLYPFINEKYGIYQFTFGGGMEHQTMTGQGGFSESLTAHELAHQWWGNMITCGKWNDIWLNEGFATYAEALWLERKPGSTGLPALHSAMNSRRPSSVTGTIYKCEPLDTANINLIFSTSSSYRKPAWVLHMLRKIVGDATFFNILAEWRAQYGYRSAITEDFVNVVEGFTGRDMNWFFNQWIYEPGAPTYLRASQTQTINGQPYLALYIRQNQTASYPVYSMPIDMVLTIGGSPVTVPIWNNARDQHYLIPVASAPTTVQLDPTPWILALSNNTTAFVQGPPKIISASPAHATVFENGAQPTSISVTFSRNVTIPAGQIVLWSQVGGTTPTTLSYNPTTFTATLTPTAPLPPNTYNIIVQETVRDAVTSLALDGENTDPTNFLMNSSQRLLPTGNGVAGGPSVFSFTINAAPTFCLGDADGSGAVNFADVTSVLANLGSTGAPGIAGDADGDGFVNFSDITAVLASLGAACP